MVKHIKQIYINIIMCMNSIKNEQYESRYYTTYTII